MQTYPRTSASRPCRYWAYFGLALLVGSLRTEAQPQPHLSFEIRDPASATLSWPEASADFVLEAASVLDGSGSFQPLPAEVNRSGGQFSVRISIAGQARYFRLRQSALSVSVHDGVLVAAGETASLSTQNLSASSPGSTAAELVYDLAEGGYSGLLSGHVAMADAPEDAISSFTQADLESGLVVYCDGNHGVLLPEVRADAIQFSVFDAAGNRSGLRTFLVLRRPPEAGPDDEVMTWRIGQGDAVIDGGPGDDAFVVRGSDGDETLIVQPTADRQRISLRVNGEETVEIDGFEDLYFILGNGRNTLELSGDFAQTDLSPATLFYFGGPNGDFVTISASGNDCVINLGDGQNVLLLRQARGSFVIGGSGGDFLAVNGTEGFQQQVFPGTGTAEMQVEPQAYVHLDESSLTVQLEQTAASAYSVYYFDFAILNQAFRLSRPISFDGEVFIGRGSASLWFGFSSPTDRSYLGPGLGFLVPEPMPGST